MDFSISKRPLLLWIGLGLFAISFVCSNIVVAKSSIGENIQILQDNDNQFSDTKKFKTVDRLTAEQEVGDSINVLSRDDASSKQTVRVEYDGELALKYLLDYSVFFGGGNYYGEKKINGIRPESEFTVDEINGPFSGTNTKMYWFSDTHYKWFGKTESSIDIKVDQEDNIWRCGKIISSFETYDATANMDLDVIGKGNIRGADGSIYYELFDEVSFDGTVYSSLNLDVDGHRVGNYGLRVNSDMGRYEIFINYKTIDNQIEATYHVEDCLLFNSTEGTISYLSDEPNMVRDLDEIARSLYK